MSNKRSSKKKASVAARAKAKSTRPKLKGASGVKKSKSAAKPASKKGAAKKTTVAKPSKASNSKAARTGARAVAKKAGKRPASRSGAKTKRKAQPPIRRPAVLTTELPFLAMNWTGSHFQTVCEALLNEADGHINVRQYGVSGDDQGGFDLFDDLQSAPTLSFEKAGYECKLEKQFGKAKVLEVIARAGKSNVRRRIILLGRTATADATKAAEKKKWEIWDSRRLSTLVRSFPPLRREAFVRDWFGSDVAETFLGIPQARAFVDSEAYFAAQLDSQNLVNHLRPMAGRSLERDQLHEFLHGDSRVLVVLGRRFIGKSRLLREVTQGSSEDDIRFLRRGVTLNEVALHEVPTTSKLTVVVDRYEGRGVMPLLVFAAGHPNIKLIIAADTSDRVELDGMLTEAGLEPSVRASAVTLGPIEHEAAVALVRSVFPTIPSSLAQPLAVQTSDSPLMAIALATIYSSNDAERDETALRIHDTLVDLYHDALAGKVHPAVKPIVAREIMGVIAIIAPKHRELEEPVIAFIADRASVDPREVGLALERLLEAGVVRVRDRRLALDSDVFSGALTGSLSTANGRSSGYLEELLDALGLRQRFLPAIAAARFSRLSDNLVDYVWRWVADHVRAVGYGTRAHILDEQGELGVFDPDHALDLVRMAIGLPEGDDSPLYRLWSSPSRADVDGAAPKVISRILRAHPEYFATCADLLWRMVLSGNAATKAGDIDALSALRDAASYRNTRLSSLLDIVDNVIAMATAAAPSERRTPIEILEPLLDHSVTVTYEGHNVFTIERGNLVDLTVTRDLRRSVIGAFVGLAGGGNEALALYALKVLARVLRHPETHTELPPEQQAAWDVERGVVLDVFARIAGRYGPLRDLQIAELLLPQLRRTDWVEPRARAILASIPRNSDHSVARIVIPEFQQQFEMTGVRGDHGLSAHRAALDAELVVATGAVTAGVSSGGTALDRLVGNLKSYSAAGVSIFAAPLVDAILQRHPEWAKEMVESALVSGDDVAYSVLHPCLRILWSIDSSVAEDLSSRLLDVGSSAATAAVVNGVNTSHVEVPDGARRRQIVVKRLMEHGNAASWAARSLRAAVSEDVDGALSLLRDDATQSAEAQDELFSTIVGSEGVVESLDAGDLAMLMQRISDATTLGYFMCEFLARATSRDPRAVINLLVSRIEREFHAGYYAVPVDGYHPLGNALSMAGVLGDALSALLCATDRSQLEDGRRAFTDLAEADIAAALAALEHAVPNSDVQMLAKLSRYSMAIPVKILLETGTLIDAIVNRASELGYEASLAAKNELIQAFEARSRFGTAGEPFPIDVEILEGSRRLRDAASPGSLSRDLYGMLVARTERKRDKR